MPCGFTRDACKLTKRFYIVEVRRQALLKGLAGLWPCPRLVVPPGFLVTEIDSSLTNSFPWRALFREIPHPVPKRQATYL
jgi:hypothetical protein